MPAASPSIERKKRSPTRIVLGSALIIIVVLLLAGLFPPRGCGPQEFQKQMEASKNARQIIIAMKAYAVDHNGAYPDADPSMPKTANAVFRMLIKGGYVTDERLFTAPLSFAHPDGNMGEAPDFRHALEPGENHWAVVTGLNDNSPGHVPLIFECANDAAWPPTWNGDVGGQPVRGRAWKGGKIVVGRNDGSSSIEKLKATKGERLPTLARSDGFNLFDPAKPMKYLQPE